MTTIQQKRIDWHAWWSSLTDAQRKFYRHKANWEHMSLSAVAKEWPVTDAEACALLAPAPPEKGDAHR